MTPYAMRDAMIFATETVAVKSGQGASKTKGTPTRTSLIEDAAGEKTNTAIEMTNAAIKTTTSRGKTNTNIDQNIINAGYAASVYSVNAALSRGIVHLYTSMKHGPLLCKDPLLNGRIWLLDNSGNCKSIIALCTYGLKCRRVYKVTRRHFVKIRLNALDGR